MDVTTKLQNEVSSIAERVEKGNRATWSIANTWDADFWAHRHTMMNTLRERGYNVSSSVNWGVVDYVITKEVKLS